MGEMVAVDLIITSFAFSKPMLGLPNPRSRSDQGSLNRSKGRGARYRETTPVAGTVSGRHSVDGKHDEFGTGTHSAG
jgi:hypothetical protein